MVIVADAYSLAPPITGVGKYSLNILKEITRYCNHEIYFFGGLRLTKTIPLHESGSIERGRTLIRKAIRRYAILKIIARFIRERAFKWVSILIKIRSPNNLVFYSPNYKLPYNSFPKVIVIHDLCHERLPDLVDHETLRWLADLKEIAKEAEGIITVSEFTKQEIISLYGIPEEKIKIASPGIDEIFTRQSKHTTSSILRKYGLKDKPYFISVATLQPRKNLFTLLKAYLMLPVEIRHNIPLLLVGESAPEYLKSIYGKGLRDDPSIRYLGYLPHEELPALYTGALAYCSSSLYEGFGIPVAEALACGTPCLLSDIPPYHEISHQKGTFFDPMDVEAWSQGLKRAAEDRQWIQSKTVDESVIREQFNWKESASVTLNMLRKVAGQT